MTTHDMRNFECEATGERCADTRCKRDYCILDYIPVPPVEVSRKESVQKVSPRKSRIPLDVRFKREVIKIAESLIRAHEKKQGFRYKRDKFLSKIVQLNRDPRVIAAARARLGIEPEDDPG